MSKTYGNGPLPNVKGKLLMTHQNNKNYVIHSSLSKCFVQHDMKVTKLHRTIRYLQARLFADYIQFNSDKRQLRTKEFEKDFFKLRNNYIYGKSVQNPFKRSISASLTMSLLGSCTTLLALTSHVSIFIAQLCLEFDYKKQQSHKINANSSDRQYLIFRN